jgi:hypothetical protein
MRVSPDPKQIIEIYVDESSQTQHQFLVMGAVLVSLPDTDRLIELITKARLPELPEKEAKWAKVSRAKLPAYKRIVSVLFDNPDLAHFHSLYIDTTKLDHKKWNDGSREIGFNKEIYQLALKCSHLYPDNLFHLYPDRRRTKQRPEDLRVILNRGCAKYGDKRDWPFRRCQFRDSDLTLPLQLTDILIGALAYQLNGHAAAKGAAPHKIELSEFILERAKVVDVSRGTARSAKFTIWPRRLRP